MSASRHRLPRHVPVGQVRRTLEAVQRFRLDLVFGALLVLFACLLGRLVKLQVVDAAVWREEAAAKEGQRLSFHPLRGRIVDMHGRTLATSQRAFGVAVDPDLIDDAEGFAVRLAHLLDDPDLARDVYRAVLEAPPGCRYRLVRDVVEDRRVLALLAPLKGYRASTEAGFRGLIVEDRQIRTYPNGSYAAHVLGRPPRRPDLGREGALGMEAHLHPLLRGTALDVPVRRDGRRGVLATSGASPALTTADVPLTLDLVVQHLLEREIDQVMDEWQAVLATGVVLDPQTGHVLALANRPTFDPATGRIPAGATNHATTGLFPPGSMFKPFTVAQALRLGVVGPDERLELPRVKVFEAGGVHEDFEDSHHIGSGDVVTILAESSNVGVVDLALRMGPEAMAGLVRDLGFGQPYGIQLAAERQAVFAEEPGRWRAIHPAAFVAHGYAVAISPLRLASAFAAFARDDGRLVRPTLLPGEGGPRLDLPPVCATRTQLDLVRAGLAACVDEGTARRAFEGASVAVSGKTGTAHLRAGDTRFNHAAFIGFAPRERPRVLVLLMAKVDEGFVHPATGLRPYGGNVAGPAVRTIIETTLAYLEGDLAGTLAPSAPPAAGPTSEDPR